MKKIKTLYFFCALLGYLFLGTFTYGFAQSVKNDEEITISDIEIKFIRDRSAAITWKTSHPCITKSSYGIKTHLEVRFKLDADYKVSEHQMIVDDLLPDTRYLFQVMAESGGDVSSSEIMSFTTSSLLPDIKEEERSAPAFQISSPSPGSMVSGTIPVIIKGPQVEYFKHAHLFVDGQKLNSTEVLPFQQEIDTRAFENGPHTICVDALHENGDEHSMCVSILVNNGREAASFRFVVIGDTRSNHAKHRKIINEINGLNPKPVMILNTGDLVQTGSKASDWKKWKEITDILNIDWKVKPPQYIGAYGNHDKPGKTDFFKKYLIGQHNGYGDGKNFFISYGNALFIVLNSEGTPKKKWLRETLKAESSKHDWIFAFWHKPPYPFGKHGQSETTSYKTFCPILQEYGAKMIFVGHNHHYIRTLPIFMDGKKKPKVDKDKGIIQIVAGGGGAHLYSVQKNMPYKNVFDKGLMSYHYCIVDITKNILEMTVKDETGKVIDTLRLELKTSDKPPVCQIKTPANHATISGYQDIKVHAEDDIGVRKVDIFSNNTLLKSLGTAPYQFTWDTTLINDGTYTLKAVAVDTSSQSAEDTISVTVNNHNNPQPKIIAEDDFETYGWKGGKGWSGAWTKKGDVKKVKLKPYKGKKYARFRKGTGRLERSIDLSTANNPVLRFAARIRSFEKKDRAVVKISSNGGKYTVVKEFTSKESDNTYHEYEIDLVEYAQQSGPVKILFAGEMNQAKDFWYLDSIEVVER